MEKKQKYKGLRARYVFIPAIIIISICLTLVIVATILINIRTHNLTNQSKNSSDCVDEISIIQSTTSKLSETATAFVYNPTVIDETTGKPRILPNGQEIVIEGTITAYLEDYNDESRKPTNILKSLEKYNLSKEVLDLINGAIEKEKYMFSEQARSFYLLNSIPTITLPTRLLDSIEKYELTSSELAMSDSEKRNAAFEGLLAKEYADAKGVISTNIRKATAIVNSESNELQKSTNESLSILRTILWISLVLVLISTITLFVLLMIKLVIPIIVFSERIDENKNLNEETSMYEVNRLAHAYNQLLKRHNEFDTELQRVAETDPLTGLPNRFSFNEYLKNTVTQGMSACAFMFDLNNLKVVNDTYGHKQGDELIKRASQVILECFSNEDERNCFRFGGDEFVAIINGIKENEIPSYITNFNNCQEKYDVSISVGYSYTSDVSTTGYEKIIMEADKKMYKNKKRVHKDSQTN